MENLEYMEMECGNGVMSDRSIAELSDLTGAIIGCAIEVHRELGPGLLESTYEQCLAFEMRDKGIGFELQKPLPVQYKGHRISCGYRIDVLVEKSIILELKSVDKLIPIHEAQMLSYMRLSGLKKGILINFNVQLLKNGFKTFVI